MVLGMLLGPWFSFSYLCMPEGYCSSKCADAPLLIFQNPKSGPICVGASNHQQLLMVCWNWKQLMWSTLVIKAMMIVPKKFVKNMAPNGAVQHFWSNWKLKCNLQAEQTGLLLINFYIRPFCYSRTLFGFLLFWLFFIMYCSDFYISRVAAPPSFRHCGPELKSVQVFRVH